MLGDRRHKLERLYSLYKEDMFYVAYSVIKDYYLAQDAVHSAFIKLAAKLETIDEEDCKKTRVLIMLIVKNTAIDILRGRSRRDSPLAEIENSIEDEAVSLEDEYINGEMLDILLRKISQLPAAYGDLIFLKYVYSLPDQEIAEMMGISVENVRVRTSRARRKLKEMLAEGKEAPDHG